MAADAFSILPLSPQIGAEITGIDLRQPADVATKAALNRAFEDHAVLAIRDQHLTAPQFLQAMTTFGEIFPQHNPRFAVPACPSIHYISNQDKLEDGRPYIPGEGYHTDHSNDVEPPRRPRCTPSSCRRAAATRNSSICARPMTRCPRR